MAQLTLDLFGLEETVDVFQPAPEKAKEVMASQVKVELIKRKRRQLILHSYLYYRMNTNLISDTEYDARARALIKLQEENPQEAELAEYADVFRGFQMGDSFGLPMDDTWVHETAVRMIRLHEENKR